MFRWTLLVCALGLVALAVFNLVRTPDWAPWKLGVLAGEFGHWLALLAGGICVAAWLQRSGGPFVAWSAACLAVLATGLFLRPSWEAWRIGRALPEDLEKQWAGARVDREPFTWAGFFTTKVEPVAIETFDVTAGLPIDFYRAARPDRTAAPCVIVIHGGGWDSGDRTQLPELNHWLARRGYAVAAISYRLAPAHRWPAQRDDVLAAVAVLKARAATLGIDPTRFVLLGRSAGGQIAQVIAYTAMDPALRGLIALYAPSDLYFGYINTHENDALKSPALMRQFLGGPPDRVRANYESASALNFVSPRSPPTLLLHGDLDSLAWNRHSQRLAARLTEHRVPHVYVALPWATHAFDFNLRGPGGQLTTYAIEAFLAGVTH
jgi:acetyl esterase/lipase